MDKRDVSSQMNQEAIFQALAKNASDGIAVVDSDGRLIFANRAIHDDFGYDYGRHEMIGLPVADLWPEEEATRWSEDVLPEAKGRDWQGEVRQRRNDGALFDAQLTVFSIRDGQEHPAHWALLVREVDGHERMSEQIADLEREIILDSVSDHVIYQDTEHRVLWPNRAACESANASREELRGVHCYEIWPQRDDRCPDCPVADAMAAGQPRQTEKQTPDGRYWFVRGYPVRNAQGEIVGGIEVTEEITERREAEDQLAVYKALADNAADAISMSDLEGNFIYANRAFYEMNDLEYGEDELIGRPVRSLTPEEQLGQMQEAIQHAMTTGSWSGEVTMASHGGPPFTALLTVFSLTNEAGQPTALATIMRDITERKQAEIEREQRLESRKRQVQLTTEISQQIAATPSVGEIYSRVVKLVKERFGYYHVQIFRYDDDLDAMRVVEGYGGVGDGMKAAGHNLPYGDGVVGTAAATGSPVLASDVTEDPHWKPHPDLPATEGELAVPIKLRDEVLGVLDVQSDEAGALTEEDQLVLNGLAGQIANAIESARLLEEVQESEERYRSYVDNAPDGIFIANDQGQYLEVNDAACRITGYDREELLSMSIPDLVAPESLEAAGDHLGQLHEAGRASGEFSFVRKDGSTGYWSVEAIKLSETRLLGFVKDITERKRATQALGDRARQLAAVAEVASAAGTILDHDELVHEAVEMVQDRFDLYYVGLFLLDDDGEWAVLRTGSGEAGRRMVEEGHKLAVGGDSMVGWCIANQEARIALDVGDEAVRFQNPHLPETHSELALPLIARGETLGALSVQSDEREAFSQEDITVFQTMVDQLATALENARLFAQTQEALDRAESLYEGSSQVTGAETTDDVLQALIRSTALQRLDRVNFLFFDHALAPGEDPEGFVVQAVWERSGEEPPAPVGTRYDFDQFPAGRVVDRDEPTIVRDVSTDERIDKNTRALILDRLGTQSLVFWPLVVGEQWIGVITGQASAVLEIGADEIRQITSMADQAAAVLQSQRLIQQSRARADRERALREITARVRSFTDPEAIVRTAVRELGTALERPTFVRLGSAEELSRSPTGEDGSRRSANGDFAQAPGGDGQTVSGTDDVPLRDGGE